MIRALHFTGTSFFFASTCGTYRYWWKRQAGVLKIQIRRADLAKFKASLIGARMSRYVDMFEIGGGWYELHSLDRNVFAAFGGQSDGLRMWVKALNEFFLSTVNANRPKVIAVYKSKLPQNLTAEVVVPKQPTQHALQALVARFSK